MTPTAWKMYRYSLLYLALLFLAMGIDRYLPRSARQPVAPEVVILRHVSGTLAHLNWVLLL